MNKRNEAQAKHGVEVRARMVEAIVQYMLDHGYPPSIREIASMVGLKSNSSAYAHLMKLVDEGIIEMEYCMPRAIKVKGVRYIDERKRNSQ